MPVDGVWTGGGKTGDWFDAGNWDGKRIPSQPTDTALFTAFKGTQQPTLSGNLALAKITIALVAQGFKLDMTGEITLERFSMDSGTLSGASLLLVALHQNLWVILPRSAHSEER
jgi:hypothetical protein